MPEPIHFSAGFETILEGPLMPYTPTGHLASPIKLENERVRIEDAKSPIEWLKEAAHDADYSPLLIPHDRIAFLFDVKWETENRLKVVREVHCQALVVDDTTIEDVITGGTSKDYQYLRADFEPENLGVLFPDPIEHVHSNSKKAPRFPISLSSAVPHVDFIELVLRNYDRPLWSAWAQRVWDERLGDTMDDEEGEPVDASTVISMAFNGNDLARLLTDETVRKHVEQWRRALRDEKGFMTPFLRYAACDLISY